MSGSRMSFQPAEVISRKSSNIELGKVSKLTMSFSASRFFTCMNDDMPRIAKITMPRKSKTAMLSSAGIDSRSVIIKRRIPRAALITRKTRKIRKTRTTRNKVGEIKKSRNCSKMMPTEESIMTMKSNTLNGSRK